jgi:hypothetical protein
LYFNNFLLVQKLIFGALGEDFTDFIPIGFGS